MPPAELRPRRLPYARAIALLGLGVLAAGLFLALTAEVFDGPEVSAVDASILRAIATVRTGWLNGVATDLTALGSVTLIPLFVLVAATVLWWARDRLGAAQLAVVAVGAGAAEVTTKLIFVRPRPTVIPHLVEVSGYSYPSGHSLTTAAVYATLALLACRHAPSPGARTLVIVGASTLTGLVGTSRLYLGVHNPSDVVSGFLIGLAWALLVAAAFSAIHTRRLAPAA